MVVESGCIFHGSRIVAPPPGRKSVLQELHKAHPAICRMNSLARGYVWWPKIDEDLEAEIKKCHICQSARHNSPSAPINPWHWLERPWSHIHVDYAGPFLRKTFLVAIDAHSKWLEVHMMSSTTSSSTVKKLQCFFSIFRLPRVVVSDNATVFKMLNFRSLLMKMVLLIKT